GDNRYFNCPQLRNHTTARRTPGEFHLTAVDSKVPPPWGWIQMLYHMPPDARTGGIDQLYFEIVPLAAPTQAKTHGVGFVHRPSAHVSRHYEAFAIFEVEIHPQRWRV